MHKPTLYDTAKSRLPAILWLVSMFVVTLSCSPTAHSEPMRFTRLSLDDSLGDHGIGAIKRISQDNIGFLWIGAEYGLARYDGSRFTRYSAAAERGDSLLSNYINDIAFDAAGVMWIATDKGLNRYRSATDNFAQILPDQDRGGNNRVAAIGVDSDNNIIMARGDGVSVLYADRSTIRHFPIKQHDPANFISVQEVFVDSGGAIWLGTKGGGAASFDLASGEYRFFSHLPTHPSSMVSNDITVINEDAHGRLWFGSHAGGISRSLPGEEGFRRYVHDPEDPHSVSPNSVWDIFSDSQGQTWVATDHGGLARYDEQLDGFHAIRHRPYDAQSISSNQVRDIFEDHNGDLWVGMFESELNFYNRSAEQFRNYQHQPDDDSSLSHSGILAFFEDSHGTLWAGTESGLNRFNKDKKIFTRFGEGRSEPSPLQSATILSMAEDDLGQLWIGTWSAGAYQLSSDGTILRHYQPQADVPSSLSNPFVWAIAKDHQGQLWFGTQGGGMNLFDAEAQRFTHFKHDTHDASTISSDYIWSMMTDSNGKIWIGTSEGVNRFDPATRVFERAHQIDPKNRFDNDRIRSFFEDSRGRVWIGTQDNGFYLFTPDSESVQHFGKNSALPALYVTGFTEDQQGYIWASTTNGLAKIDPDTLTASVFNKSHGLISNNFNREANFIDRQGQLYFGSSDGVTLFDPSTLVEDNNDFPVLVTGFRIVNKPIEIGAADSPLSEAIWFTKALTLSASDNMFTFDFSALEFSNNHKIQYAYQLQGFSTEWIDIGTSNNATFTNLSPGLYTFRVKAGAQGNWSKHIPAVQISVLPSPWQTWWAYTLYALVFAIVIYLLINTKLKQVQLASERQTNAELTNLNRIKDSFLANTSHELRTPLNGIIGIAEALSDHFDGLDEYATEHLNVIATSGRRLATLINDILDYSKLANQNLEVEQDAVHLQPTVEAVFALLAPLVSGKPMQLINALPSEPIIISADENRLQQILVNIVGNGIKYCAQGHVKVGATLNDGHTIIFVEDTGIGIADNEKETIFEAFHQIESCNARQYGGTGLGLAITRQLVELHHGRIWVGDTEPQGTTVYFTLGLSSKQASHLRSLHPLQFMSPNALPQKMRASERRNLPTDPQTKKPRNAEDQTILIVDDDSINRMVLQSILKHHNYHVIEADNGQQAIDMVNQNASIDLIIMDIMMPKLTGFEACAIIREQHPLHSLPIIFLTAKSNAAQDLELCFAAGGNDYVNKPVSKHDILPRIANHIRLAGLVKRIPI